MITIRMNTAKLKLTIDGHATPAESGEWKEICAATSALAQALMYSLTKYNDGKDTMKSVEYRPEAGNMMIRVFPETWAERGLRNIFKVYGDGLQLLAESHPQSVEMIRDEERIITKEEGQ